MFTAQERVYAYLNGLPNKTATQAEIANALKIPPGTVGGACAYATRWGYMTKQQVEGSKRPLYTLTDAGRKIINDATISVKKSDPEHKPQEDTYTPSFLPTHRIVVPASEPTEPTVLETAIDNLADALVGRITAVVDQKIAGVVEGLVARQVADSLAKLTASITKDKPKHLPRVVVLGLHKQQMQLVRDEFDDLLDIKFIHVDDHISTLKSAVVKAAQTFVMADFVSHSHTEAIKSTHVVPVLVRGGIGAIKEVLLAFVIEQNEQGA